MVKPHWNNEYPFTGASSQVNNNTVSFSGHQEFNTLCAVVYFWSLSLKVLKALKVFCDIILTFTFHISLFLI